MRRKRGHRVRTGEREQAPHDVAWLAMVSRHRAALEVIRTGIESDGELLLSYVIWPTEWMNAIVRDDVLRGDGERRALRAA